jgi:Abi-like protein
MALTDQRIEQLLGAERLGVCVDACDGSFARAVQLYRWNAGISATLWQPLGHVEIAMRNAMSASLDARHERVSRAGSWLDDPAGELDGRMRRHIVLARRRVRQKGKCPSDAQTISELGFGFWRYLVTRRHTRLWPDLASAFAYAPDRRRETVEDPLARLHELRNRIAHHQRVWNRDLVARYDDLLLVAGFLDPGLPAWIKHGSGVPGALRTRPAALVS